jgi:hypothetical protein
MTLAEQVKQKSERMQEQVGFLVNDLLKEVGDCEITIDVKPLYAETGSVKTLTDTGVSVKINI